MREDREEMTMVGRLFTPTPQEVGTAPTGWLVARRLITVVWLVVCLVQIAIWGTGDIVGGHLTFPWWLPTVGSGVATLVLLSVITGMVGRKRD
jgi:hypothetical protein